MRRYWPIGLLLLFYVVSTRHLWLPLQYAFGDFQPFPNTAGVAWHTYVDGWTDHALGMQLVPLTIELIDALLLLITFNHAALAEEIFISLIIPLAMVSGYYLARRCNLSQIGATCCAIVFALNPAVLGDMLGGTEPGTLFGVALLPFALAAILNLLESPSLASGVVLGGVTAILLQIYPQGILLYVPSVALLLLSLFVTKRVGAKQLLRAVIPVGVAILVIVLISAPWLEWFVLYPVRHSATSQNVTFSASTLQLFLNDVKSTFYFAPPELVVRLGGVAAALGYEETSLRNALGYTVVVWIVLGVLYLVRRPHWLALWFGLSLAVLCLGFVIATHFGLTYGVFWALPVLFAFRNPTQIMLLAALGVALVAGSLSERLMHGHNKPQLVCGLVLMVAYLGYISPSTFSGDFSLGRLRSDGVIDPAYSSIAETVVSIGPPEYYRVLWLPGDYESVAIKMRYSPLHLIEVQYGVAQFFKTPASEYLEKAFGAVAGGETRMFGHALAPLLGLFIVIDKQSKAPTATGLPQVVTPYRTPYLTGAPEALVSLMREQKDLSEIYDDGRFVIFLNSAIANTTSLYGPLKITQNDVPLTNGDAVIATQQNRTSIASVAINQPALIERRGSGLTLNLLALHLYLNGTPVLTVPEQSRSIGDAAKLPSNNLLFDGRPAAFNGEGCIPLAVGFGHHVLSTAQHVAIASFDQAPLRLSVALPNVGRADVITTSISPSPCWTDRWSVGYDHAYEASLPVAMNGLYLVGLRYKNTSRKVGHATLFTADDSNRFVVGARLRLLPSIHLNRVVAGPVVTAHHGLHMRLVVDKKSAKNILLGQTQVIPLAIDHALLLTLDYSRPTNKTPLVTSGRAFELFLGSVGQFVSAVVGGTEAADTVLLGDRPSAVLKKIEPYAARLSVPLPALQTQKIAAGRFYIARSALYGLALPPGQAVPGFIASDLTRQRFSFSKNIAFSVDNARVNFSSSTAAFLPLSPSTHGSLYAAWDLVNGQACGPTSAQSSSLAAVEAEPSTQRYALQWPLVFMPHALYLREGWHSYSLSAQPEDCAFSPEHLIENKAYATIGAATTNANLDGFTFEKQAKTTGGVAFFLGPMSPGIYDLTFLEQRLAGPRARITIYAQGLRQYIVSNLATNPARTSHDDLRFTVSDDAGALVLYFYLDSTKPQLQRTSISHLQLRGGATVLPAIMLVSMKPKPGDRDYNSRFEFPDKAVAAFARRQVLAVKLGGAQPSPHRFWISNAGRYSIRPVGDLPVPAILSTDLRTGQSSISSDSVISVDNTLFALRPQQPLQFSMPVGPLAVNGEPFQYYSVAKKNACGPLTIAESSDSFLWKDRSSRRITAGIALSSSSRGLYLRRGWHTYRFSSALKCPFDAVSLIRNGYLYGKFGALSVAPGPDGLTFRYSKRGAKNAGLFFYLGNMQPGIYKLSFKQMVLNGEPARVAVYDPIARRYLMSQLLSASQSGVRYQIPFSVPSNAQQLILYFYLQQPDPAIQSAETSELQLRPGPIAPVFMLQTATVASKTLGFYAEVGQNYNSQWDANDPSAEHVVMGGYSNAWIVPGSERTIVMRYQPAAAVHAGAAVSLFGIGLTVLALVSGSWWSRVRR